MNKIVLMVWAMTTFVAGGCATRPTPRAPVASSPAAIERDAGKDAEITSSLLGTWRPDPRDKQFMDGSTTYRRDGTGTDLAWPFGYPDRQVRFDFLWSVSDGLLTVRLVKSNAPPGYEPPARLVDKIVSISDRELVIELFEGYPNKAMIGKRETKIRIK